MFLRLLFAVSFSDLYIYIYNGVFTILHYGKLVFSYTCLNQERLKRELSVIIIG